MLRSFAVLTLIGTVLPAIATGQKTGLPEATPELIVSLMPATGFVPLASEDYLAPYRFQVSAVDTANQYSYGSAETVVNPGQARTVSKGTPAGQIRASVRLAEDGLVSYAAEIVSAGRTLARTSATVRVQPAR